MRKYTPYCKICAGQSITCEDSRVSYKSKHKRITHLTYMLRLAYVELAKEVKSQATDDTKLLNLACKALG